MWRLRKRWRPNRPFWLLRGAATLASYRIVVRRGKRVLAAGRRSPSRRTDGACCARDWLTGSAGAPPGRGHGADRGAAGTCQMARNVLDPTTVPAGTCGYISEGRRSRSAMVRIAPVSRSTLTRVSSSAESTHSSMARGRAWPDRVWQVRSPGSEARVCHAAERAALVRAAVAIRYASCLSSRLAGGRGRHTGASGPGSRRRGGPAEPVGPRLAGRSGCAPGAGS